MKAKRTPARKPVPQTKEIERVFVVHPYFFKAGMVVVAKHYGKGEVTGAAFTWATVRFEGETKTRDFMTDSLQELCVIDLVIETTNGPGTIVKYIDGRYGIKFERERLPINYTREQLQKILVHPTA